jgi:hypothetical protein
MSSVGEMPIRSLIRVYRNGVGPVSVGVSLIAKKDLEMLSGNFGANECIASYKPACKSSLKGGL